MTDCAQASLDQMNVCLQRLRSAADMSAAFGYAGLASDLDDLVSLLPALPSPDKERIAEALLSDITTEVPSARGTRT